MFPTASCTRSTLRETGLSSRWSCPASMSERLSASASARALRLSERSGISGEVIVADNGSTDGSIEIAEGEGARVVKVAEKGYGSALKGGILAARGDYVLMADSDDSYDLSHIPRFVEQLRAGADLVMGNRFSGGIADNAMPFLHRYLGNPVLTGIGRLFFDSTCKDFHCGMRVRGRPCSLLRRGGLMASKASISFSAMPRRAHPVCSRG